VGKCRDLLLKAIAKHNDLMNDARNGQGCDRHLFGLQCLAFENNIPTPEIFKDPSWTKRYFFLNDHRIKFRN
jgi:carnitine O-octanoyltransferase